MTGWNRNGKRVSKRDRDSPVDLQGGEERERGTEMPGLFEALPTRQSSPCDCCLWHGAEVQALSLCFPPTTCVCVCTYALVIHFPSPLLSSPPLPPSLLCCSETVPASLWRLGLDCQGLGTVWLAAPRLVTNQTLPVLWDTLVKRVCALHAECIISFHFGDRWWIDRGVM